MKQHNIVIFVDDDADARGKDKKGNSISQSPIRLFSFTPEYRYRRLLARQPRQAGKYVHPRIARIGSRPAAKVYQDSAPGED